MAGCARKYAECPGLGEEKRNIPGILYIGIFDNMVMIIILKLIMKGVEIDSKTQQDEKGEHTNFNYKLFMFHRKI